VHVAGRVRMRRTPGLASAPGRGLFQEIDQGYIDKVACIDLSPIHTAHDDQ